MPAVSYDTGTLAPYSVNHAERMGPFERLGSLFVVGFESLPNDGVAGVIRWRKSVDGGVSWADSGGTKSTREPEYLGMRPNSTIPLYEWFPGILEAVPHRLFPSVPQVFVFYIDASSELHCSVFNVSSETWVLESNNDPRIWLKNDESLPKSGPLAEATEYDGPDGTAPIVAWIGGIEYSSGIAAERSFGNDLIHVAAMVQPDCWVSEETLVYRGGYEGIPGTYSAPPRSRVYRATLDTNTMAWNTPAKLANQPADELFDFRLCGAVRGASNSVYVMSNHVLQEPPEQPRVYQIADTSGAATTTQTGSLPFGVFVAGRFSYRASDSLTLGAYGEYDSTPDPTDSVIAWANGVETYLVTGSGFITGGATSVVFGAASYVLFELDSKGYFVLVDSSVNLPAVEFIAEAITLPRAEALSLGIGLLFVGLTGTLRFCLVFGETPEEGCCGCGPNGYKHSVNF